MSQQLLKIGTRKSNLAVTQAESVAAAFLALGAELEPQIVKLDSSGDKKRDLSEAAQRDKKDWVIEFEDALVAGAIDVAVHSAKDVPVDIHPDTELISVMPRVLPYDCLILKSSLPASIKSVAQLPNNSVIGTTSRRRQLQLKHLRKDLSFLPVRGNVQTRIDKLEQSSELSALVLAVAGLRRLNLLSVSTVELLAQEFLPAVNQGILALQFRKDDSKRPLYRKLVDPLTQYAFEAERAVIAALGADCGSAVGVYAETNGAEIKITANVLGDDPLVCIAAKKYGAVGESQKLADSLVQELFAKGAKELL